MNRKRHGVRLNSNSPASRKKMSADRMFGHAGNVAEWILCRRRTHTGGNILQFSFASLAASSYGIGAPPPPKT